MSGTATYTTILFFSGTGTDVGKTYCAALAARQLISLGRSVGVYKPVASGCQWTEDQWLPEDACRLWEAAARPRTLGEVCPQRFGAAVAPPEAARREGTVVDPTLLVDGAMPWIRGGYDFLIVEGAGGLFSPLAERMLNVDLFALFPSARLIIVADNRLGVIHQVLATCEAAAHRGVTVAGIVLSRVSEEADASAARNAAQIGEFTDVPILGEVGHLDTESRIRLDQFGASAAT